MEFLTARYFIESPATCTLALFLFSYVILFLNVRALLTSLSGIIDFFA